MLDIKFIRENTEVVKAALKARNSKLSIDELLALDEERRKLLVENESLKAERNKANDEISAAIKAKKNPKEIIDKMKVVSQKVTDLDKKVIELNKKQGETAGIYRCRSRDERRQAAIRIEYRQKRSRIRRYLAARHSGRIRIGCRGGYTGALGGF